MKTYRLRRIQLLHTTLGEAWRFFSCADNLRLITPKHMNFKIVYRSGKSELYAGQLIYYKVNILPGVRVDWLSEITHVQKPYYFVDEQRSGPYSLWQHQHSFKEVKEGIELTDEVNYAVPLGLIGRLANVMFVERSLNAIFDYRFKALEELFKDDKTKIKKLA